MSFDAQTTSTGRSEGRSRDSEQLLTALTGALRALHDGGSEHEAIRASFVAAREGLGANAALLLAVHAASAGELELEVLESHGLTPAQLDACCHFTSVPGVSSTTIRLAIENRQPVLLAPGLGAGKASTTALAGGQYSVLCAPIVDRHTSAVTAVLYFQTKGIARAYNERDRDFFAAWAAALAEACAVRGRMAELAADADASRKRANAPLILGDSLATTRLRALLDGTYAEITRRQNPPPILILGESGTGKDVVARYLHHFSQVRARGPYVAANCATFAGRDMAAAALFGHARGAFTGAITAKKGLFRDAHRGVLFLDEIGDLDAANQALLLRAIETRSVQPVGESHTAPFDTQLILATHHDLPADVQHGKFRADLWHRISAFIIRLAPLRDKDRYADIRPLMTHFIAQEEQAAQKRTAGLQPEALRALLRYAWPGNVRELYNVATRLVTHAGYGLPITLADIGLQCPEVVDGPQAPDAALRAGTFAEAKNEAVRMILSQGLEAHNGNLKEAAEAFGLRTHHLLDLLRRHGLRPRRDVAEPPMAE